MTAENGPEKDDPKMGGKEQRPYATLDLEASEVSSRNASADDEAKAASAKPDDKEPLQLDGPREDDQPESGYGAVQFVTHMAAGVLGALVALIVAYYSSATSESPEAANGERAALIAAVGKSEQRIEALEKALGEANGRAEQIKAAADERRALTQQLTALSERIGRAESQPSTGLTPEAVQGALDPVNAKIGQIERRLEEVARTQTELQTNSKAAALAVALYNLRRAAAEGKPYAVELRSVAEMSPVTLDLSALDSRRDKGIPSLEQLNADFKTASNAALDAENQPVDESLASDLWAKAKGFIRIRRKGDVPGDGTRAILARVEHRLNAENLPAAIAEAEQLKGPAAEAMAKWLEDVKAKRAADEALAQVEATLLTALSNEDRAKRGG